MKLKWTINRGDTELGFRLSGCQSGEDSFDKAEAGLPNGCILTNSCNNSDAITCEHNMSRIVWCGSFSKFK